MNAWEVRRKGVLLRESRLVVDKTDEIIYRLERQGYYQLRMLPDGSIAGLSPLLFTTALCVGLTLNGWEYRFCYTEESRALHELNKLKTDNDVPSGWVARRYGSGEAS